MRTILDFECQGHRLAATCDTAPAKSGLLIVSGGNEIRIGAHRGIAMLAERIAQAGYPVFRFDRRGIGDSEGDNAGFKGSGPDVEAAMHAFCKACPSLSRIVALGNCDAATALLLCESPADAFILTNPWVIEASADSPPVAAIRAHYRKRLLDPAAWKALAKGAIDLRKAVRGVARLLRPEPQSSLALKIASKLQLLDRPTTILLASGDGTAQAFADQWQGQNFAAARANRSIELKVIESSSHSLATGPGLELLTGEILKSLAGAEHAD